MANETENTEVKTDVVVPAKTDEVKPEPKESVVAKIAAKVKDFVSGGEVKDEGSDIPDEFTVAAKKIGWEEEDIRSFAADYSDEDLKEMIPFLLGEDTVATDETSDKGKVKDEVKTDLVTETKDKKVEDSQESEQVKKLLARIEALESAQGKSQEERKQQETSNLITRASQLFDEASKEFEVFGTTEKLPTLPDGRIIPTSPAMKARVEVFDLAARLNASGMPFDDAMSVSLNAFKGKNLAKDVKRSVIKDLKKNESKLGGKRTSHESTAELTYGPDVIRAVAQKHGREIA